MPSLNSSIGGFAVGFQPHASAGSSRSRFRPSGGERSDSSHRPDRVRQSDSSNRPDRTRETSRPERVERTRSKSVSDSASLSLKVTTAEGDTVELSVEAQSLRQSERSFSRDQDGVTRSSSKSQSESVSASIKVDGDLSEEELADIQKLLGAIGTGPGPDISQTESLSSYDYSLSRSHEVNITTLEVYA